jgi:hypothetical protein
MSLGGRRSRAPTPGQWQAARAWCTERNGKNRMRGPDEWRDDRHRPPDDRSGVQSATKTALAGKLVRVSVATVRTYGRLVHGSDGAVGQNSQSFTSDSRLNFHVSGTQTNAGGLWPSTSMARREGLCLSCEATDNTGVWWHWTGNGQGQGCVVKSHQAFP